MSSPQLTSSPKKHRHSASASAIGSKDDITEHTEPPDSAADISLIQELMATDMASSTSDRQAGLPPHSTSKQYMNVPFQLAAGPPVIDHSIDPNMIQTPMNLNSQQMLNFGTPHCRSCTIYNRYRLCDKCNGFICVRAYQMMT